MKKYINPYNLFVGSFIPNWLLRREEVSPGAKLCYARLSQFAGRDGECFPSQAVLAAEIGAGERQIRRYIGELEKHCLIETVQVGLNQPNRYRFLWHKWMEENDTKKRDLSRKSGGGKDRADRTFMSTPDRTKLSSQDRSDKTDKESQLKDSSKTTTKSVVVDERQIENVKKSLAPIFLKMPDDVISALIEKKGFDHVISIADQTAYQLNQGSVTPKNPIGYFVALTLQGMNKPQGYKSLEEKAKEENHRQLRTENRCRNADQGWNERVPLEMIKEFIRDFA